jgi:Protein of unknown function (DUF4230)
VREWRIESRMGTMDDVEPLERNPSEQKTVVIDPLEDGDRVIVHGPERGPAYEPRPASSSRKPSSPWASLARTGIIAVAVIVVLLGGLLIVLSAAGHALSSLNPFRDGIVTSTTIDRSGPAVMKSITQMGELKAASGYYQEIVDVQRDVKPLPSFLAGERTLFIAAGTADATVDLSKIGAEDIEVSEDGKSVTVTVPAPVIGNAALDLAHSRVYTHQKGLLGKIGDLFGDDANANDPAGLESVYKRGQQQIGEAARATPELVDQAKVSTTSTLQGLLRALGFTDVTVVFDPANQG